MGEYIRLHLRLVKSGGGDDKGTRLRIVESRDNWTVDQKDENGTGRK